MADLWNQEIIWEGIVDIQASMAQDRSRAVFRRRRRTSLNNLTSATPRAIADRSRRCCCDITVCILCIHHLSASMLCPKEPRCTSGPISA